MAEWVRNTQREISKVSEGGDTEPGPACRFTDKWADMLRHVETRAISLAAVGDSTSSQVRPPVLWRQSGEGGAWEGPVWEKMGINGCPRLHGSFENLFSNIQSKRLKRLLKRLFFG